MTRRKPKPPPKPDPTLLVNALAPDPCDFGALLAAEVDKRRAITGESETAIAIAAGLQQPVLNRALRNPDARPSTVRAVCRLLGLRVALVPVERGE